MAWPKPKNRRSPARAETSSNSRGGAPDGARLHPGGPEPAADLWRSAHPAAAQVQEAAETDPGDRPFWESWGRVDDETDLDEPGDGFPADGPADDAVTDVDPRPARSWEPVIATAGEAREQPKPEGIGQHLGSVAHLSASTRMRGWRR